MTSKPDRPRLSRRQFVATSALGAAFGGLSGRVGSMDPFSQAVPGTPASGAALRRVIIDTDPGVDDAFALLFAMRSPELKIEAITPVAGNVPLSLTLPNALRMVEIAGRTDIPVARGASAPLMRKLVTATYAHGENGLAGVVFPEPTTKPVEQSAAELIYQVASRHPGEVSIIAIGPLTNVATALRAYPPLEKMIAEIVLMGGSLSGGNVTPAAEFNLYVDPEAASIVFGSGIPLTMVGLDVTRKAILTEAHVKTLEGGSNAVSRAAARIGRAILEQARRAGWTSGPAMHDPLAVATFLDKSVVQLENYFVAVETAGQFTSGETVGYRRAPLRGSAPPSNASESSAVFSETFMPNANVAVDLSVQRFFGSFISRLAGTG
ncbi:MAG TPA: nucleoside hydrolase [Terriglobia bacterium]|nr:nucleoside hydrolase [Terriglobia bacterium]